MAGPPWPSFEKLLGLGDCDSACGKKYEATWANTMNARLCRRVYSMRYAVVDVQNMKSSQIPRMRIFQ
jgi:hypothetical protein